MKGLFEQVCKSLIEVSFVLVFYRRQPQQIVAILLKKVYDNKDK